MSTSAQGIDQLLLEWRDVWLDNIYSQVVMMHHRREIHDGFVEMLREQDHPDASYFGDAYHYQYIDSQVMAIRRQADGDTRTISLKRLIGQIEEHRAHCTRTWYVGRWMDGRDVDAAREHDRLEARMHLEMANDAFDRFADESGGEQLSRALLHQDRDRLMNTSQKVIDYSNTIVAHSQHPSTPAVDVTYDEFNAAIDLLGELLKRYHLLIDQGGLMNVAPAIQGDWRGPFRQPMA